MAFIWGTEMLKSLKIKQLAVDLCWLHIILLIKWASTCTKSLRGKQVHNQISREICQYATYFEKNKQLELWTNKYNSNYTTMSYNEESFKVWINKKNK